MRHGKKWKIVLATGFSADCALALISALASRSDIFLVLAADADCIAILNSRCPQSISYQFRQVDILSDQDLETLVEEITVNFGTVDILINSAGYCIKSTIEHMDAATELTQLRANYLSLMCVTRAVLPSMRERGKGRIINISFATPFQPTPTLGSYSAAGAALESATEALRFEGKPFNISVGHIRCHNKFNDDFQHVFYSRKAQLSLISRGPYSSIYQQIDSLRQAAPLNNQAAPSHIAKKILQLIDVKTLPLWNSINLESSIVGKFKLLYPSWLRPRIRLQNSFFPKT